MTLNKGVKLNYETLLMPVSEHNTYGPVVMFQDLKRHKHEPNQTIFANAVIIHSMLDNTGQIQ